MEPRIQYAKTSDGVSIAYAVLGDGPPIVYIGSFPGSIHLYSHFALSRRWVDGLTDSGWQVIRYDGRGTGSSDRDAVDFSLEARLRDLEAVVERVGSERFALCGHLQGALAALAYAARRPERVSRLVLSEPFASGGITFGTNATRRMLKAMLPLAEEHWELMALNIAHLNFGFTDSELAGEFAAALQSGISAAAFRAWYQADEAIDVTELLESVSAPTLIMQDTSISGRGGGGGERAAHVKRVAAGIPNARLVTTDDFASAVGEFLREGIPTPATGELQLPSGMTAILFADIFDSTALTERLGDTAFREKARHLDIAMRAVIRECQGTPVEGKLLGDGVLAVFGSARQAIEAALQCGRVGDEAGLPLHLGLHAGDVIREENNVYGGAVNIASRISGLSAPGQVLVSRTIADLARTSAGVVFEDRGEHTLKGVDDPVRLFAVRQA